MIVRTVDSSNDWTFGKGRNDYRSGIQTVEQRIRTRLQCFIGDCFFDTGQGLDWLSLLGAKNTLAIKLAVSTAILNTENVTGLIEVSTVIDNNRKLTISYKVQTTYGAITDTFQYDVAI